MVSRQLKNAFNFVFFPKPCKPPFGHICQVGDPVLRMVAEKVPSESITTPPIQKVIYQMVQVMKRYKCHGISAPQIGIPLRIIAMEVGPSTIGKIKAEIREAREIQEIPLTIVVNPELKVLSRATTTFPEGCESLRGYSGDVQRFKEVQLSGLTPSGTPVCEAFSGWGSRIAQHEMDHLDGRLCIDKMDLKTFQNDAWHRINVHEGRVKIKFI